MLLKESVLLLIFNRPTLTRAVFEAVRQAEPPRLYVAADGPRPDRPEEVHLCDEARAIATAVDWPCELHTLFRDRNLGCGQAVSEAISWFFEQESSGIVLEDDCLPHPDFFAFAAVLLDRYRDDSRIGQICGFNLLPQAVKVQADYFASHFGWSWGWASWRRAWQHFDLGMTSWPQLKAQGLHGQYPFYPERIRIFDQTYASLIDTWDYQWHYALASMGALSLVPRTNLVRNIGFTDDATHTRVVDPSRTIAADALPLPLSHPSHLLPDPNYERSLIRAAHPSRPRRLWQRLVQRLGTNQ